MSVRHFRMIFLSLVLSFCSTACFAQTCEPGHKFTPADHERIVAAIANDAGDVIKNVDFREINRANRANRVLEGALKAEGISPSDKQCIREVLKAPPVSIEALQKEEPLLGQALARIRAATNLDELEAIGRCTAYDGRVYSHIPRISKWPCQKRSSAGHALEWLADRYRSGLPGSCGYC